MIDYNKESLRIQNILNKDLEKDIFEVKYDHCGVHDIYIEDQHCNHLFIQPDWHQTQSDFEKNGATWMLSDGKLTISRLKDEVAISKIVNKYGFEIDKKRIKKDNIREKDLQDVVLKLIKAINDIHFNAG